VDGRAAGLRVGTPGCRPTARAGPVRR
jgi:hypothetical protein